MKGGNNIEENTRNKYVASCSFGKDSIATILLALENNEPLDEIAYCKVMFDKTTSGEVPEHEDFIQTKAIPFMEKNGLKVNILCQQDKNYITEFMHVVKRGKWVGHIKGFPLCGRCNISRDLKLPPILKYQKSLAENTKSYVGIAYDEQERLLRLKAGSVSLLEKYHFTEEDAKKKCIEYGLLSPIYEFSNRGGCWFCPNAKKKELRHLYDYHKDLWNKMLELQALPNKCTELFNRKDKFSDIDRRFRIEDAQIPLFKTEVA